MSLKSRGASVWISGTALIVGSVAIVCMLVGLTSTRATSRSLMRLNDVRVLQIGDLPLDSQGFSELVLHMPQVKDGLNYVPCAETLKLTFDPAAYVAAELTPNGCVRISVDGLLQAYPVNIGADPATYWVAIDGDGWAPCAELPIIFEAQPKGSTIVNLCVSYGTHPSQDGLRADCSIALTWSCDETSDCRLQYFVSESFMAQSSWHDGMAVLQRRI